MAMNAASSTSPLRLVGLIELDPVPGDHSLIATGFARLPREVRHTGGVTRLMGYEGVPSPSEPREAAPVVGQKEQHDQQRQQAQQEQQGEQVHQRQQVRQGQQVCHEQRVRQEQKVRFFGIEVEGIEDIPAGMYGIELG